MSDPTREASSADVSEQSLSSVMSAVVGLRDGRALVALSGCAACGIAVAGLIASMAGSSGAISGPLAALVCLLAVGIGVNAAGALQMADVRGVTRRSLTGALVFGMSCLPRLALLALALLAGAAAVFIALAAVFLIGKMPLLGPLVFAVALPLSVVVAGITVTALAVCLVLSLPALWQGESAMRALGQTLAVARTRPVESLLLLLVVAVLVFAVGVVVFGVLASGLVPSLALSAAIIGFGELGLDAVAALPLADIGGPAFAGGLGLLTLWVAAGSWVGQVWLRGLALVYLRVTEDLDPVASEAALRAAIDGARRRAGALGERSAGRAEGKAAVEPARSSVPAVVVAQRSFEEMVGASFGDTVPLDPADAAEQPPPSWQPTVPAPFPSVSMSMSISMSASMPRLGAEPAAALWPAPAPAPLPVTVTETCRRCRAASEPGDAFCFACGNRLSQRLWALRSGATVT